MTLWIPFTIDGTPYDLTHLHPKTVIFEQAAKGEKPARKYTVNIEFGLHCFTRGFKTGDSINPKMIYSDARERRLFDIQRYELSKRLPEVVEKLATCKCYHTEHGNFFTVEIVKEGNITVQYEVYFALSRSSKKGILNLFVQSAYVRDQKHQNKSHKKSIGLFVLLFNTSNNHPIKPAPK